MADGAAAGLSFAIAFRFTERIIGDGLASERGVFRLSGDGPRGPLPVRFGRFHTLARRDGDRWRLVFDYEDAEAATEAEYDAADRH